MNIQACQLGFSTAARVRRMSSRHRLRRRGIIVCIMVSHCVLVGIGCNSSTNTNFPPTTEAEVQAQALQMADDIENDAGLENTDVRSVVDGKVSAPQGALYGLVFDDTQNTLYVLGEQLSDEEFDITGAVLEDVNGHLILMEEITPEGAVTLTVPTGDSVEFTLTGDGISVTYTLAGTSPPSTIVVLITPDGDAIVDEAASDFFDTENPAYSDEPITLPRSESKVRVLAADRSTWRVLQPRFDCPIVNKLGDTVNYSCAALGILTREVPKAGIEAGCLAVNDFLTGFTGTPLVELPGDSEPLPLPRVIAAAKLGTSIFCTLAPKAWDVGQVLTRANAAGLLCLGSSIVSDGTVLITGESMSDVICELIGGDPISSGEQDPVFDTGCENTCEFAGDGSCDDGGPGADTSLCELGTDCDDCGVRDMSDDGSENPDCGDDGICNMECPIDPADPDCTNVDFCENFEICCDGDSICDLVRCPGPGLDSDCTNYHLCDRLEVCCDDDDRCDDAAIDCPESDRDCAYCGADGYCITECVPEDPDCSGDNDCPADGFCDTSCIGVDPDCDSSTSCEGDDCEPQIEYVVWFTGNVCCWGAPLIYITTRDVFDEPRLRSSFPGGGIDPNQAAIKVEMQGGFETFEDAAASVCPRFTSRFNHYWCGSGYLQMDGQNWQTGNFGCDEINDLPWIDIESLPDVDGCGPYWE